MPKNLKKKHARKGRPAGRKLKLLVRPRGAPEDPRWRDREHRRHVVRRLLVEQPGASCTDLLNAAGAPEEARKAFRLARARHGPLGSLAALATRVNSCVRVVVLLGAGASVAAGIPCFRGAPPAREAWLRQAYSCDGFRRSPGDLWSLLPQLRGAQPTPLHLLLGRLAQCGRLSLAATQNVDGLELLVLPPALVAQVHGSARSFRCALCGTCCEPPPVSCRLAPRCPQPSCAGRVRPDIVFRGEPVPPAELARARAAVRNADLVLVVGTSLAVDPFARLWQLARTATRYCVNVEPMGYASDGEGQYVGDCQSFAEALSPLIHPI